MDFTTMKRKELQSVCKKHGIPANLSNAEMVKRISLLLEVKEKQKAKSCLRSVNNEVDNVDEESKKVGKRVKFSPENETFEFERTDPRACRLLARKRRGTMKSKIEADPGSVSDNVKNPVGNSRNSKRKTMINVKVDEGLVSEDVGKVEKSLEGGNIGRNLRSRVKKMTKGEEDSTLVSPCIERRAKRGRKGSQVEGVENKVSVIDETENDALVIIRRLRSREVRIENLHNEKSKNVVHTTRRSYRQTNKGKDDESNQDVVKNQPQGVDDANLSVIVEKDRGIKEMTVSEKSTRRGKELTMVDASLSESMLDEIVPQSNNEHIDEGEKETVLENEKPEVEVQIHETGSAISVEEKEEKCESIVPVINTYVVEPDCGCAAKCTTPCSSGAVNINVSFATEYDPKKEGVGSQSATPMQNLEVGSNSKNHDILNVVDSQYTDSCESSPKSMTINVSYLFSNSQVDEQFNTDEEKSEPENVTEPNCSIITNPTSPRSNKVDNIDRRRDNMDVCDNVFTESECIATDNSNVQILDHYIPVEKVKIASNASVEENIQTLMEYNEGTETTTPSQNLGGGSRCWDNQESSEAFSGSSSMNISSLFRSSPIKEQCLVNDDYNVIEKSEETYKENIQLSEESPTRLNIMSGIVSTPLSTRKRNFNGTPLDFVAPERSRDRLSCVDASIPMCTSTQKLNILESGKLHLGREGSIVEFGFSFESKLEDCTSSFEKSGDEILIAVDQGEEPEPKDVQVKDQWKEPELNDGRVEDQWEEPEPNDGQVKDQWKEPEPNDGQVEDQWEEPEPNDGQVEAKKPEPKGDQVVHHEKEPEPNDGQVEAIKPEPKGDQVVHHEQEPDPNDGQVEGKKPEPKGDQVVHHENERESNDGQVEAKKPEPKGDQVVHHEKEREPNDDQVEAIKPEPKGDQAVHHEKEPGSNDGQVEAIKPEPKGDQVVHHEQEPEPNDGQVEAIKPEPKGDQVVHHDQEPEPNDGQVEAIKPEPKGDQVVHHEKEPEPNVGQVVNHEKEPELKDGQVEVQGKEPEPKVGQVVNQEKEVEPNELTKIGDPSAETGAEPPIVMEKGVETDTFTPQQNWETEFRSINEDARYTSESQATDLDSFPNINTMLLLSHSAVDDELIVSQDSLKKGERSEGETMRNLSSFDNITKKGEESGGEIMIDFSCFENITKKGEENEGEITPHDEIDVFTPTLPTKTVDIQASAFGDKAHTTLTDDSLTEANDNVAHSYTADNAVKCVFGSEYRSETWQNTSEDKASDTPKRACLGNDIEPCWNTSILKEDNRDCEGLFYPDTTFSIKFLTCHLVPLSVFFSFSFRFGAKTNARGGMTKMPLFGEVKSIDNVNSPFQSANDKSLIEVVIDKTEAPWPNARGTKCLPTPEPGKASIDHGVEKSEVSGCRNACKVVERISGFAIVESEKFNLFEGVLTEFAGDEGDKILGQPNMKDYGYEGLSPQTPGDGRGSLRGIDGIDTTPERINDGLCEISEGEGNPDHENSTETCIFSKWELDFIYGEIAKEMNEVTLGSSEKSTSKENYQTSRDEISHIHESEVVNPSSIIESNVKRSNSIHGTPKKPIVFSHDMKENAPTSAKVVDLTAVKPIIKRKALGVVGK